MTRTPAVRVAARALLLAGTAVAAYLVFSLLDPAARAQDAPAVGADAALPAWPDGGILDLSAIGGVHIGSPPPTTSDLAGLVERVLRLATLSLPEQDTELPGQGYDPPPPGQDTEPPAPGQGTEQPAPGQGTEQPAPGQDAGTPPGQDSAEPPAATPAAKEPLAAAPATANDDVVERRPATARRPRGVSANSSITKPPQQPVGRTQVAARATAARLVAPHSAPDAGGCVPSGCAHTTDAGTAPGQPVTLPAAPVVREDLRVRLVRPITHAAATGRTPATSALPG